MTEWIERSLRGRREAAHEAGKVRGKHFTDWIPTLNAWRSEGGHDGAALELLLEIIDAAERSFAIYPSAGLPPGYTKRAAIIYRRRNDLTAELALLDRFLALDQSEKITVRRDSLLKLMAR